MCKHRFRRLIILFILTTILLSCGPLSPPESCGAGGTADRGKFNQLFRDMVLVYDPTGELPLMETEGGPHFSENSAVGVQFDSLQALDVRFCVEERRGGGEIIFDDTMSISEGTGRVPIGSFFSGSYVVRIILDEMLLINMPFTVD